MGNDTHTEHHITPLSTYLKIAGALFVLTFLTVGMHALRNYTSPFSPLIAFSIAGVKAYLVMAYFMHLKFEKLALLIINVCGRKDVEEYSLSQCLYLGIFHT